MKDYLLVAKLIQNLGIFYPLFEPYFIHFLSIILLFTWENKQFAYAKTRVQISFAVTAKLISTFVFATRIVQSLYFPNKKFHASSCLLLPCSPICVRPSRKPHCWFSHEAAHLATTLFSYHSSFCIKT